MKLNLTELETVISLKVHKSIYRRMFLRLEIDFIPVYFEGYYGTRISKCLPVHKSIYRRMFFASVN